MKMSLGMLALFAVSAFAVTASASTVPLLDFVSDRHHDDIAGNFSVNSGHDNLPFQDTNNFSYKGSDKIDLNFGDHHHWMFPIFFGDPFFGFNTQLFIAEMDSLLAPQISAAPVSAVPLPASFPLFGLALLGLAGLAHRKSRASALYKPGIY